MVRTLVVRVTSALAATVVAATGYAQCQSQWLPGAFGQFGSYGATARPRRPFST